MPGLITDWVITSGIPKLISFLFPTFSGFITLYQGLKWAWDNLAKLSDLTNTIVGGLKAVVQGSDAVTTSVLAGFNSLTGLAIDLLADILGLKGVRDKIVGIAACVLNWLQSKVNNLIDWLAGKLFGQKMGTTCKLPGASNQQPGALSRSR